MTTTDKLLRTLGPQYSAMPLLTALLSTWASKLDEAIVAEDAAAAQLSIRTASAVWLDLWGHLYAIPRLNGETDDAYANRLIAQTIRQRPQIFALEDIVNASFILDKFFVRDLWPFTLLSDQFDAPQSYAFVRLTNALVYSQDFSQAQWVKDNLSAVSGAMVAPDGTATAQKLVESGANGVHRMRQSGVLCPTGSPMTFSMYAMQSERTKLALQISDGGANFAYATFDLFAGTATMNNGGSAVGNVTAKIVFDDNGFHRCELTWLTIPLTSANILASVLNEFGQESYDGDNVSGLFVWGAQINTGAAATTYLSTGPVGGNQLRWSVPTGKPWQVCDGQLQDTFFIFGPNTAALSFSKVFVPGSFGIWVRETTSQLFAFTLQQVIVLLPLNLISDQFNSTLHVSDGQLTTPGFETLADTARHSLELPVAAFPVTIEEILAVVDRHRAAGTQRVVMDSELISTG